MTISLTATRRGLVTMNVTAAAMSSASNGSTSPNTSMKPCSWPSFWANSSLSARPGSMTENRTLRVVNS
jgi:hypothetical protein